MDAVNAEGVNVISGSGVAGGGVDVGAVYVVVDGGVGSVCGGSNSVVGGGIARGRVVAVVGLMRLLLVLVL